MMGSSPTLTRGKAAERRARDERLAQALRDNLRRRKEQKAPRPDASAGLSGALLSAKSKGRGGEKAD